MCLDLSLLVSDATGLPLRLNEWELLIDEWARLSNHEHSDYQKLLKACAALPDAWRSELERPENRFTKYAELRHSVRQRVDRLRDEDIRGRKKNVGAVADDCDSHGAYDHEGMYDDAYNYNYTTSYEYNAYNAWEWEGQQQQPQTQQ